MGNVVLTPGVHTFALTYPHSDLTPGSGEKEYTYLTAIALAAEQSGERTHNRRPGAGDAAVRTSARLARARLGRLSAPSCEDPPMLQRVLALPETADLDVDGANRLEVHAAVLRRKPMLAAVFRECHELMLEADRRTFGDTPGLRVELGAGVAPISGTFPEVLATDVVPGPGLDRVLDAQDMDLPDGSVRALYGQNCFHHLPDPLRFLTEAERVVAPGGGVVLIEPYYGPVASVVFKRLFASEEFDKAMPGWTSQASGPMQGANQALSYIVFVRDRALFERELPSLELTETFPLTNYVRYLLSGGLNFRQLVPSFTEPALRALESALRPARRRSRAAPHGRAAPARVTGSGEPAGRRWDGHQARRPGPPTASSGPQHPPTSPRR